MLQRLHEHSKGWIAWIVISLISVAFMLFGIEYYLQSRARNVEAAVVNGEKITSKQVNALFERLRQQQLLQFGAGAALDPALNAQLRQQALSQLILEQVLRQAVRKEGFLVSQAQAEKALLEIAAFQEDGRFSQERFYEALRATRYSPDDFVAQLRSEILVNQLRSGIIETAFVMPKEVNNAINLLNQRRDIQYVTISAERFAKDAQPSEKQERVYYQNNKEDFKTPEKVSIQYIELSLPAVLAKIQPDKAQLEEIYKTNLDRYSTPKRWHTAHILIGLPKDATEEQVAAKQKEIQTIAVQLKAGGSFSALAKQYSTDQQSANDGGKLPWFSAGMFEPAFEQAVAKLQNPGDVSAPVKTKYGFHLIKLLAVQQPQVVPFAKVEQQIKQRLIQTTAQKEFDDLSEQLASLAFSNPDSLEEPAKELGLPIKTSPLFSKTKGEGITANAKVIAAAFSADVLEQQNNSDLVQVDEQSVIVLRIKEHISARFKPFKEVRNQIQQDLAFKAKKAKAKAYGQKILNALRSGSSSEALATKYQLKWQVVRGVDREAKEINPLVIDAAFSLPPPSKQLAEPTSGVSLASGDYVLVTLKQIKPGEVKNIDKEQLRLLAMQIENSLGQWDFQLYLQALMKRAEIEIKNNEQSAMDES